MKSLKWVIFALVLTSIITGCYTERQRVVEREIPAIQDNTSTATETPDNPVRIR